MVRSGRFTLVELMVVVAIIATLAAIAIPQLYTFQLKSKKAEIPLVLDGIRDESAAYLAAFDVCPDGSTNLLSGFTPRSASSAVLDKRAAAWTTSAWGWNKFSYRPDGKVRATYNYECDVAGHPSSPFFKGSAFADIDNDNVYYSRVDAFDPNTPPYETCETGGSGIKCF